MAPIRDWTGAITISPLPYCEIAAGWRWGICCGDCHNRPSEAQHSGFGGRLFPYLWAGIVCGCVFK